MINNYIRKAFTDLHPSAYSNSLSYNVDHSGFVYTSSTLHQDYVFYPSCQSSTKDITQVSQELVQQMYKKNLIYNILPFPIAFTFGILGIFLFFHNILLAIGIMMLVFFLVLYVVKMSLNTIAAAINYKIFLIDDFTVLKVYENLGQKSDITDKVRSHPFSPFEQNFEILANSSAIERRLMDNGETDFVKELDRQRTGLGWKL